MKNTRNQPVNIPASKLRPFSGHPFKVKDDEEMNTLTESVQTQEILSLLIARPIENTDEYEVISGHRRLHAAVKAGITEVPALIVSLTVMRRQSCLQTATYTESTFCPLKKPLLTR